uniref:Protein S100-A9-like n=1 Tax=Crotalus adamanteus TaxID=8729 RepID=J3SD54_CROAD
MSKTQLEKCCDCIMDVFHKYSMPLDHPDKLSKGEFAKMLREQLPNFIQSTKNTEAMNRLFNELDQNKDGELSFEEWLTLIGRFLAQCHENFHHKH